MVLNKSKWDKRAKVQYLRKHGLLKPRAQLEEQPERHHWTSKSGEKAVLPHHRVVLEDSDEEAWDSEEDEAFINDFYPQLGETELTKEQKVKIKKQILGDIALGGLQESTENDNEEQNDDEEVDGIYLGTEPSDTAPVLSNLDDFLAESKPKTSRKLLKARISDNLLAEYGLESYSQIAKPDRVLNTNKEINFDKLSTKQLAGFRVGESTLPQQQKQPDIRYLTEEEMLEKSARDSKSEQQRFYNQLRKKFDSEGTTAKVLEIDNFNAKDHTQVANLHQRIMKDLLRTQRTDDDFLDDLSVLLGTKLAPAEESEQQDLDSLLHTLDLGPKGPKPSNNTKLEAQAPDSQFLDDLLG